MRRVVLALVAVAVVTPAAHAATTTTGPVYDSKGRLVQAPFAPTVAPAKLNEKRATAIFLRNRKVADWLDRYPTRDRVTDATYEKDLDDWKVGVWWGSAGQIASGRVDDQTGLVTEAWTGPQVAWKMARGSPGAFGGRQINSWPIWLGFCVLFFVGLADLRRPLSVRNLDLLVLLSFSVSLWFFNRGDIFTAVPLAYPPMAYLLGRMVWVTWRGGPERSRAVWPVWLLAAGAVFLTGFRVGLNLRDSNVIDVGYSGVIGAERIVHGEMPYGHMPKEGQLKPCGPADSEGETRERVQTNGRCESANERGDTYGPAAYEAYIPGYAVFGWSGKWDDLPAAHATSVLFDLLALLGLALVGRRFGGARLSAALPFAWAAYPFTQYVSSSNTNDAIMPVFLIFGFWLVTSAFARGAFVALAGWTKFAALLLVPLWAFLSGVAAVLRKGAICRGIRRRDRRRRSRSCSSSRTLLTPPASSGTARSAGRSDATRRSRSGAGASTTLRGFPTSGSCSSLRSACSWPGRSPATSCPRRKTVLQLAALTAAVLIGFELTLTHWFYLYIPWFFPFVAFVVLAARRRRVEAPPPHDDAERELVATG